MLFEGSIDGDHARERECSDSALPDLDGNDDSKDDNHEHDHGCNASSIHDDTSDVGEEEQFWDAEQDLKSSRTSIKVGNRHAIGDIEALKISSLENAWATRFSI